MKTNPKPSKPKDETPAQREAGDRNVARAFAGQWPAADTLRLLLSLGAEDAPGFPDLDAFLDEIARTAGSVRRGDMTNIRVLLHDQAVCLNALGQALARRALDGSAPRFDFTSALAAFERSQAAVALLLKLHPPQVAAAK